MTDGDDEPEAEAGSPGATTADEVTAYDSTAGESAGDSPAGETDGDSSDGESAETPSVTPAALQARIDAGDPVRVLDLRNRDEVDRWRIAGPSVSLTQIPHNRFVQARVTGDVDEFVARVDGEGPITTSCARGEASASVAGTLVEAGHDARNLAGGMEEWARLLQRFDLDAGLPDAVTLRQYRRPASGCLGYAVVADGEAAVVDPLRAFTDRYVADVAEMDATVEYVVDTHVHADHVSGLRDLADAADAEAVMPERGADRGVAFDVSTLADGETVDVGPVSLEAVHAPGHTAGMTAFAVGDALLTGDSLFVDGVARPDLERGAEGARELARELYRTLTERFGRFDDGTVLAPGHHGPATAPGENGVTAAMGSRRQSPPFDLDEAAFVEYVTDDLPPRPANAERIVDVNLGRASATDDEAFELELGPNNCAAAPVESE